MATTIGCERASAAKNGSNQVLCGFIVKDGNGSGECVVGVRDRTTSPPFVISRRQFVVPLCCRSSARQRRSWRTASIDIRDHLQISDAEVGVLRCNKENAL